MSERFVNVVSAKIALYKYPSFPFPFYVKWRLYVCGAQTIAEWETVYLIASIIHFLGVTFYAIFASGEKQPWAEPADDEDEVEATADNKLPPVNKAWSYGTTAEDAGGAAGLYQTTLEMVQRPVDQTAVRYSNGSACD